MTSRLSSAEVTGDRPGASAAESLYAAIGLIRRLFHLLTAAADELHGDLGVTTAQRAVLEALVDGGPATVPALARSKRVSRQHIQVIANELIAAGLVELAANPAHRRSSLIRPTAAGAKVFEAMRARERRLLRSMAASLNRRDLGRTVAALAAMCAYLEGREVKP